MNSLINRLNVRTSSFSDNVPVKDLHVVTPSDVAAALSFSQMPELSYDLMRAKYLNENTITKIEEMANKLITGSNSMDLNELRENIVKACAVVAIVEFCKVPADYKPSGYNRAKIIGVSESTYRRLKLAHKIKQYSDCIENYYAVGRAKLGRQFASLNHKY